MNEHHASALEAVKALHALGATYVQVGPEHVEVKFDRVFVPVQPNSIGVRVDGDEVVFSAEQIQSLRDENEHLRSIARRAEELGVL